MKRQREPLSEDGTYYSKEEWWDVIRMIDRDITWENFEAEWAGFLSAKAQRLAKEARMDYV